MIERVINGMLLFLMSCACLIMVRVLLFVFFGGLK